MSAARRAADADAVTSGLVPASSRTLTRERASMTGLATVASTAVPVRLSAFVPLAPERRNPVCAVDIAEAGRTIACTGTRRVGPLEGVSTTYADCSERYTRAFEACVAA